jgi:hypothetical protein
MCNPVAISLAMTAAGSAAQAAGQSKAQKAMDDARQAERIRQAGLQNGSSNLVSESLANASATNQADQQGKATDARKAAYEAAQAAAPAAVAPTNANNAGDQKANAIINTEAGQRSAAAHGFSTQQGNAKAAMQGFNDLQKTNEIYNNRMLQQQGTIGNFMQGSAGVLPYEVEAAGRKGNGLKSLGDILSLGGAAVGMGAGSGMFAPADQANTITSSLDMSKVNPSMLTNPGYNPLAPKPFDPNWINKWMKANNITPPIS